MSDKNTSSGSLRFMKKHIIRLFLKFISLIVSSFIKPKRSSTPQIEDKVLLLPAVKLSEKIKNGQLTSEQVTKSYISRIEKANPKINAVAAKNFENALNIARDLDKRITEAREGKGDVSILKWPLIGVPLSVKETVSLEGSAYTGGLPSRKLRIASKSNGAVEQLIGAGLVPLCSTNTPCMNLWWDTYNLLYGRTLNPYDLSRIVGGSSGGEAALIAVAGSLVGVGSDLAGSIRIPCNFCGIFGHKATPFTVSNARIIPAMRKEQEKMRGVGPMTRYAGDLLPMLEIMAKQDELPKLRLREPVDLRQIKIFYIEDLNDPLVSKCNSDILAGFRAAMEHFSTNFGIKAERANLEEFRYGIPLWSAELDTSGKKIYTSEHEDGMMEINSTLEFFKSLFGTSEYPFNTIFTLTLEKLATAKYGSPKHSHLIKKAAELRRTFYDLVGENGVLLMPTQPEPAPHHETTILNVCNVAYTAVCNTLQAPITHCPLGMSKEGLPFGVQVIAKPYNDRITLAIARELEKAFGGWLSPSKVAA